MATIEYFYAGYSAFAYIGSAELQRIAQEAGCEIDHRPIDLRQVVARSGTIPPPERTEAHRDYYFGREIIRWAEHRNIPVMSGKPTHHDNDITLSNCMLIAGQLQGVDMDRLSHEMLKAHWVDDYDLDNRDDLMRIGQAAGIDPVPLLDTAMTATVRDIYEKNTKEAIARSVFGSPTYFVEGDMFYGQDHLELVARALETPYRGRWPR